MITLYYCVNETDWREEKFESDWEVNDFLTYNRENITKWYTDKYRDKVLNALP